MLDRMSANLAANLKRLREARDLTQADLAGLSEVPRPTLAHLESGTANPTLSVLAKVAHALQVSIEQLVAAPWAAASFFAAGSLPSRTRGSVVVQQMLPERLPGMSIERIELPAGTRLTSPAASTGTRVYVICEAGALELRTAGEFWTLHRGDLLAIRNEQSWVLVNRGRGKAVAYGVVALAPLGS
jgi:transcriptional regulator with XRE-family HTH domain